MNIKELIGKTLAVYDDGKVRFSRLEFAKVLDVIPYKKAPGELKKELKMASVNHEWIFEDTTPYFIKCEVSGHEGIRYFALSKGETYWFDIYEGFMNAGELDVTGNLSRWLISEIPNMTIDGGIEEDIKKLKEIYEID